MRTKEQKETCIMLAQLYLDIYVLLIEKLKKEWSDDIVQRIMNLGKEIRNLDLIH